jgi:hypothetical protein
MSCTTQETEITLGYTCCLTFQGIREILFFNHEDESDYLHRKFDIFVSNIHIPTSHK